MKLKIIICSICIILLGSFFLFKYLNENYNDKDYIRNISLTEVLTLFDVYVDEDDVEDVELLFTTRGGTKVSMCLNIDQSELKDKVKDFSEVDETRGYYSAIIQGIEEFVGTEIKNVYSYCVWYEGIDEWTTSCTVYLIIPNNQGDRIYIYTEAPEKLNLVSK